MSPPAWTRALLALDHALARGSQLRQVLRDEILWAWLPESQRQRVTDAIYTHAIGYRPGDQLFARGLDPHEEALLARPEIPRTGRVLLGGAGGGRELLALCKRGYGVTAFEPAERLWQSCANEARAFDGSRVLRGNYRDLDAAVDGRGPLASIAGERYAFVVLGWRSLSHVLTADERAALFRALRTLAPDAPILATFAPTVHAPGMARRALRRVFAALGAPSHAPPGAWFVAHAGFAVTIDRDELSRAASAGDYGVEVFGTVPDGFALLVPRLP